MAGIIRLSRVIAADCSSQSSGMFTEKHKHDGIINLGLVGSIDEGSAFHPTEDDSYAIIRFTGNKSESVFNYKSITTFHYCPAARLFPNRQIVPLHGTTTTPHVS